jgi:SAM-dependent methyltransferase
MWWQRALTVPHVMRLTRRAPRGVTNPWDHFWAGVTATGDDGDVLWDAGDTQEASRYLDLLSTHADPRLPIVDIGCGNGRFTRALAARFPHALGVDISPAALARARAETTGDGCTGTGADTMSSQVTFGVCDITEPGAGSRLREQLGGDANVFVRGVFHVLEPTARRNAAASIAALVGEHGVVLLAETNYRGPRLGYLERLGAGPRGVPRALASVIASGLSAPQAFGRAELEECFSPQRWHQLVSDVDATITTVPPRTPGLQEGLPGFVAVLTARPARTITESPP